MEILKKIDMHIHAVPEIDVRRPDGTGYLTPPKARELYDRYGIEKGVLLPQIAVSGHTDTLSMREARQLVENYPDTFGWWFCNVAPVMGSNSPATDFSYFLMQLKEKGAKGVGELTCNYFFDDPFVLNLFSHCEKCGLPVLFHVGSNGGDYGLIDDLGLPRLEKALRLFPKLIFIGHSQKFWAEISADCTEESRKGYPKGKVVEGRVPTLMRRYPNLHADLSACSGFNALTRDEEYAFRFMEEFRDRLYFGTDICTYQQADGPQTKLSGWLDKHMQNGDISYEVYRKISRDNALRLLTESA